VADSSPELTAAIAARLRAAGCVFAEDEARLLIEAACSATELDAMARRRACGLPLEHVLGWAEFCGLRVAVDRGVFVPRRRTEFLVRQAVLLARQGAAAQRPAEPPVVLDLCCGSGAVGAALAAALAAVLQPVELHAADVDPAAVACARRNVTDAGGRVYLGDLYQPLPSELRGRVTILTANVPYVPSDEIRLLPAEARVHEPRAAVDGGPDGLEVLRRVAASAPSWLAPGGRLLSETSERQAPGAAEAFRRAGLTPRIARSEELGATVIIGTVV
jgi:release factor glutamine methyltransferase